jgi:hypothetical protein
MRIFCSIFFIVGLLALANIAQASPCSEKTPPIEYSFLAPSKSVFTGATLLSVSCSPQSVSAGIADKDTLVFETGYVLQGTSWVPFSFSGKEKEGQWFMGEARASLRDAQENGVILAYVCEKVDGVLRCGCRDKTCTSPSWSIVSYKEPTKTTATTSKTTTLKKEERATTTKRETVKKEKISYVGSINTARLPIHIPDENDIYLGTLSKTWVLPKDVVTLSGMNFSKSKQNEIYFDETLVAKATSTTGTGLSFSIPENTKPGKYTLTIRAENKTSVNWIPLFVQRDANAKPPAVANISPSSLQQGDTVTIKGSGFAKSENLIITSIGTLQDIPSSDGSTLSFSFLPFGGKYLTFQAKTGYEAHPQKTVYVYVINENGVSNKDQTVTFTY